MFLYLIVKTVVRPVFQICLAFQVPTNASVVIVIITVVIFLKNNKYILMPH